ncbi:hypothetical protein CRUP_018413 [Coryphaenoides rupestris]|nr:hypothetical protein CRUP_018413 [Coryphaenoides rupestris]
MTGVQILAFLGGLVGLGATIGATVSNEWRATSRASSVITATWILQGLWSNCAGNAIGALHCRPHHSLLNMEGRRPHYTMSGVVTQIIGFVLSTSGWVLTSSTVATDYWKVSTIDGTVITTATFWSNLWKTCVTDSTGVSDCKDFPSLLALDGYIQACRALMIGAVCLGFFGSIFSLVGMRCTTIGGSEKSKARIACFAGVVFILSGMCSLSACSLYAHHITAEFYDPTFVFQKRPQIRYIYRGAPRTKTHSNVSSSHRGPLKPAGQKAPPPDYSSSSHTRQFDKNAYV